MRRRKFIGLVGVALGWPRAAGAQQRTGTSPATILVVEAASGKAPRELRARLLELGYQEGRDVSFETYTGKLAALASELERRRVDVIFANGPPAVVASQHATHMVPIIALDLETDPIAAGSSRAMRGRAETLQASSSTSRRWSANGYSSSVKRFRLRHASQSSGTRVCRRRTNARSKPSRRSWG
jgi:hypothetical protein